MKTVVCDSDVTVTASGPLRHICPYRDELDHGAITIRWSPNGETFELHALAEYLDGYSDLAVSHEAVTEAIYSDLSSVVGVADVRVETFWQTAGLGVKVKGRDALSRHALQS